MKEAAPPDSAEPAWHTLPPEELLARISAEPQGLSSVEAARRLSQFGPNELREASRLRPWAILVNQFKSFIVWLLIVAGGASGLLHDWVDAIAIFAIVALNAVIGFYQELSAEKSIAALKRMTAPRAKVRRDGAVDSVPAAEVVPGDIIELAPGDLVPADARLLAAASLQCVESALTGESESVLKRVTTLLTAGVPLGDRENMVFMGTNVAAGAGHAVVVTTAMATEFGRIARLIESTTDEGTPLQKKLQSFGKLLAWAALGMVGVLFALGLLRGTPAFELFMTSVSLAVAAVPEGLPAVVTVALAVGVSRMARRRALVRKLHSVETLGSTTVICSDKTGTLTRGEMTVRSLFLAGETYSVSGEGYAPTGEVTVAGRPPDARQTARLRELAWLLAGCNHAHLAPDGAEPAGQWRVIGTPTEGALLALAMKLGASREAVEEKFPKLHEFPFDSERKRRTIIRRAADGAARALVTGAPDLLLRRCAFFQAAGGIKRLTDAERERLLAENAAMAGRGLRVLGAAFRDLPALPAETVDVEKIESDLVFAALTGLQDPPRPEARPAVAECRRAGIRVVMITGDHPHTALAVARELGLAEDEQEVLAGTELDALMDENLRKRAATVAVYARVSAEHKLRIVRALKAGGAVVAMTGDGVNDAPAIKGADIGIAMGRAGTEVTKQASDMIITDDNFASIVAAVEEGRGIYDNIRKTLQYLLASNSGELLLIAVAVIAGWPMPLLPIHLLWINLVTDGLPALCLAVDPIDPGVMRRPPRRAHEKITDAGFLFSMLLTGVLTAGSALAAFLVALQTAPVEVARTHAFTALVFAQLFCSFSYRSESRPVWRMSLWSNLPLALVVGGSLGLQLWIQHNATLAVLLKTTLVSWGASFGLLALALGPLAVLEGVKCFRRRRGERTI